MAENEASPSGNRPGSLPLGGVAAFFANFGTARLAAMGAVAVFLIGFFALMIFEFQKSDLSPLYSGITFEDSTEIINKLEAMNETYELKSGGTTILVPQERVLSLRMSLAESGLPTGGGMGYELFDKTSTLGSTSFVQNINRVRALEGELARTIRSLNRIRSARIHLNLPQRRLFEREKIDATASIVLNTSGTLDAVQIRAIQHLTASAVEGLKPSNISIVDEAGRLLLSGSKDENNLLSSGLQERQLEVETRLRGQVEDIVASVVGMGRVRVRVHADIDHNRIVHTEDNYDPDGQVVRSTRTRNETSSSSESSDGDAVSVGNEIPDGIATDAQADASARTAQDAVEEITNYEISRVTRTETIEPGTLKRLSVAVLVDGNYEPTETGGFAYVPRTPEEIEKIQTLVRTAIGFDQKRGDQLEVINLQFALGPQDVNVSAPESSLFEFGKNDIVRMIEVGVLFILTLLIVLLVVRPLLRRVLSADGNTSILMQQIKEAGDQIASSVGGFKGAAGSNANEASVTNINNVQGSAQNVAPPAGGGAQAQNVAPADTVGAVGAAGAASDTETLMQNFNMPGLEDAKKHVAMQAASIKQVAELIESNPDAATNIVRSWLAEKAA